ncbi:MAG: glycosyltransferase [Spirochaetaceae bacterium]
MKISIITVSFNSEKTISDTIESVLNQTFKNIQYVIVDGNSTDNTVNIIKSYENTFKKNNIDFSWISENDDGLYDAMNKGINIANGDVVGILNSDDFYYDNNVLSDINDTFINEQIDCLYGKLKYVEEDNVDKITRIYDPKMYESGLFEKSWTPGHPTFYCKKEKYDKYGLYRTDFIIASDQELMYRFLENFKIKPYYMDRFIVTMREGGISQRGFKNLFIIIRELKDSINSNGGKFNTFKYVFYKLLKVKQIFLRKRENKV